MRVLLIHNPKAGDGDHESDDFRAALRRRGDKVDVISKKAHDLKSVLRGTDADLLVAAGGDGTVAKVVRALVGHGEIPLLIIPAGTANNIAGSLGIDKPQLDLRVVREKWVQRAIDVAIVDDEVIVEAAGCGVLAAFMRAEKNEERDGVRKEAKTMAERVESTSVFDFRVIIDGDEIAGEALMIEAMLLRQIGPNLVLARDADPGDGVLDVVIAREEQRAELLRYLKSGGRRHLPELPVRRAKSVTIACDAPWHFDDKPVGRKTRTITVRAGAWNAFVPARA